MSLINCPECRREISDKAASCPHCGYPISNNESNSYTVILDVCGVNKMQVIHYLKETQKISIINARNIIDNLPYIISSNVSKEKANELKYIFESVGATIIVRPYCIDDDSHKKININEIRCPRCGSNQITTGKRGFSFMTGFIGANKTINRCAKCGHSWMPS